MNSIIPAEFSQIRYNVKVFPGTSYSTSLQDGANCQVYAYSILRSKGYEIPEFRSSELWEDQEYSEKTEIYQLYDLLLFNRVNEPYGAHVTLYWGKDTVLHLSSEIGIPEICTINKLTKRNVYKLLVGAKRLTKKRT